MLKNKATLHLQFLDGVFRCSIMVCRDGVDDIDPLSIPLNGAIPPCDHWEYTMARGVDSVSAEKMSKDARRRRQELEDLFSDT